MKIIIAGCGKVGSMLTGSLSEEGHDLTIIDNNPQALENTIERYDVMSVEGNCAAMAVLRDAGVESADLLITATGEDELNLLCCMTAHGMNPNLHTIARIRRPDYVESTSSPALRKMFALSLTVNPERQTATEIDRLLRYPAFIKREKFANGLVEIVEIKVDKKYSLCDKPLTQLTSITHCQVLVCAVLRNGKYLTPTGDFVIHEDDRLFVTASSKNLSMLMKNIGIAVPKTKNVTIIGGGRNCFYLTRLLRGENIGIKIIEKDMDRCEYLAEMFPDVQVVQGDASLSAVLEREKIERSDAVIVMTTLDELNVIISIYARSKNVPQVITKLGRAENQQLIEQLPIGTVVSPKAFCCETITTYVRAMTNQVGSAATVHLIADGKAVALEFLVDSATKHLGKPLREIRIRRNILMASITRGRNIIIPNGDSSFMAGDRIVLVAQAGTVIHNLNDIFVE